MNPTDFMQNTLGDMRSGWIPPHIYSDPAVFEREGQRLFSRTWQFLAHESEVPNVGDYVVRSVLDDSFIVVRSDDGQVRALLNMCRHRGMQICRAEAGNAKRLLCPYHAWSYSNDGKLAGVPFLENAFGGEAGLNRDEHSLVQPATEIFSGLVFVNLDPQPVPLTVQMGDFATYLRFYTEPTPAGVEVRGPQRWRFKANWKIGAENFAGDSYHTPHTHASIAAIGVMSQARANSRKDGAIYYTGGGAGATFKLGDGSFEERLASIGYDSDMAAARAAHWPEAIHNLIGKDGFVPSAATLFPNLSMLHLWAKTDAAGTVTPFTTLRLWQPVSAQETEMLSWFVVDKTASDEFKESSYKAYLMCFGSTGMFEQDDMENWALVTRMSRGHMSRSVHLNSRMGLAPDGSALQPPLANFSGPGVAHVGFSEHNQRHWMEMWADYMEQQPPAPHAGPCSHTQQPIMMKVAQ